VLLDHYFIPPLGDFAVADPDNVVALIAFLLVAGAARSVVGLAARHREAEALATANAESREEFRRLAEEQAALRRVATLVARGGPAAEVFAAVAQEIGSVLGADATPIARVDPDGAATVVAIAGDPPDDLVVGSRWNPEPSLAMAEILRTGRAAHSNDYSQASGASGDAIRRMGARSGVAAPIIVEGHLWGMIAIVGRRRFPANAEQRMAGFTELVVQALGGSIEVDSPPEPGQRSSSSFRCGPTDARPARRCRGLRRKASGPLGAHRQLGSWVVGLAPKPASGRRVPGPANNVTEPAPLMASASDATWSQHLPLTTGFNLSPTTPETPDARGYQDFDQLVRDRRSRVLFPPPRPAD
jgi:hypothetical protein